MAERRTTNEETSKRAVYTRAEVIPGGGQPATVANFLHQRIVVTSLTEGTVALRYAPRAPKASGSVNTDS
jgi:hypothetical protein